MENKNNLVVCLICNKENRSGKYNFSYINSNNCNDNTFKGLRRGNMVAIKRINRETGEVLKTYELYKDEEIIVVDGVIYIVTKEEYSKYINGEIETYEFEEAGFDVENTGDIFKI